MEGKLLTSFCILMFCVAVTHAGVSYIRWGRTSCPQGNILLYKGYMAGNPAGGTGNGANYVCISQEPKFTRGVAGMQDGTGQLYGVEFIQQAGLQGVFLTDNLAGGQITYQDMVCARCHVPDSADVFMLPGRDDCQQSGYDLQYKGFLVSEAQWQGRTAHEYVCLDEAPEGRVGGTDASNQGYLYNVQIGCGSLPCNPFIQGMEATCAVCAY